MIRSLPLLVLFLTSTRLFTFVSARAILGVDLGSLYMKVALVQSGSPLEIVTNLHSKRKTEQMVLFDNSQRFYGADASALLARKSQKTPTAMSVLLGRDEQHPVVQVLAERHYPLTPQYNETRSGVTLTIDGQLFTPEELVAMVLTHAVDISVAYSTESGNTIAPPRDVVLTTPMYSTVKERLALLDAASLADMNVLTLIDENTAAALHYAMDKNFEDNEQLLLFYNLGASALQVSLVRFFNYEQPQKYGKPKSVPALEVLGKAWDETCGGLAFDHLITESLADEFNKVYSTKKENFDIRTIPRAMTKLRLQANKVKHVLSANNEIPIHMDSVYDDISLSTRMTRDQLESMASELLERAVAPVQKVLDVANKTLDDLTGTELIGGGMRIPSVQNKLSEAVGNNLELGMHINSDESFALGAAFAGANISTAFRVRSVGMTDVNPFAMSVSLSDLDSAVEETGGSSSEGDDDETWSKQATIFKAFGKVGVKKTIAFTHDKDVHCALDYVESDTLPKGTELALQRYNISGIAEFAKEKEELGKPKISLQFELSSSGITSLIKAEAAVEETYTVEEEVEVDDDEAEAGENATDEKASDEAKEEDDAKEDEKTEETEAAEGDDAENKTEAVEGDDAENKTKVEDEKAEKPKKTIKVEKEKKKVHKKPLTVSTYYVGRVKPHSEELLDESKEKLVRMAERDKERMMLEEARNKVESYIYKIKNKLVDDEEVVEKFADEKQREEVRKLAEEAEEWMYEDGYTADLATMEDKYAELSVPFEKILLRIAESTARPEMVEAVRKKLTEIEDLLKKWEESKPQITEEERSNVTEKIEVVRKWIDDKEKEQAEKKPHEAPAFLSEEVPGQIKPIEYTIVRLNRKPKPKPEKKEEDSKNETDASAENATASTDDETVSNETKAEETPEEESTKTEEEEEGATKTENEAEDASSEDSPKASDEEEDEKEEGIQEEL